MKIELLVDPRVAFDSGLGPHNWQQPASSNTRRLLSQRASLFPTPRSLLTVNDSVIDSAHDSVNQPPPDLCTPNTIS